MPRSLLRQLGFLGSRPRSASDGLLSSIESRLEALGSGRAQFVAAFAGLLARVAYSDGEISDPEAAKISRIVAEHSGLSCDEAEAVALIARTRMVETRGSGTHLVTRRFNEVATEEEKLRLVGCLYEIATSDDLVTHVEDREIRRIGDALLLPKPAILETRSRYREKLEELQQLRRVRAGKS